MIFTDHRRGWGNRENMGWWSWHRNPSACLVAAKSAAIHVTHQWTSAMQTRTFMPQGTKHYQPGVSGSTVANFFHYFIKERRGSYNHGTLSQISQISIIRQWWGNITPVWGTNKVSLLWLSYSNLPEINSFTDGDAGKHNSNDNDII